MHYEEYGIPTGKPVVILHGGPGGGLIPGTKKLFNLKKWRIIMFDQRGCGKSLPRGIDSLKHNTTWDLVEDIEKLRKHLSIEKWVVFGGSWGTTLGLAYAETHPKSVSGIILRGVCLLQKWEHDWLYRGGFRAIWPEVWEKFEAGSFGSSFGSSVGSSKKSNRTMKHTSLVEPYNKLLHSSNRHTRRAAAKTWWNTEHDISFLIPKPDTTPQKQVEELAVLENHYFRHNAWLGYNQLLDNAHKLKGIPIHIIQGRYDTVCPIRAAWEFCQKVPHAKMTIIPDAGHGFAYNSKAKKEVSNAVKTFL